MSSFDDLVRGVREGQVQAEQAQQVRADAAEAERLRQRERCQGLAPAVQEAVNRVRCLPNLTPPQRGYDFEFKDALHVVGNNHVGVSPRWAVEEAFTLRKRGRFGREVTRVCEGWSFSIRSGDVYLHIHLGPDGERTRVGMTGNTGRSTSIAQLLDDGQVTWHPWSTKEMVWPGGTVNVVDLMNAFLEAAAELVVRASR